MVQRVNKSSWTLEDNLNVISTADLGAQNTNITADIADALASGFSVCVVPGTWNISSLSLPSAGILFGLGPNCILKSIDAANSVAITLAEDSILSNFCLDGNKLNQVGTGNHGVHSSGANNFVVQNMMLKDQKGCGIFIDGSSEDGRIYNNSVTQFTESGIRVSQGSDLTFMNNFVFTSDAVASGAGIALSSNGGAITNVTMIDERVFHCVNEGILLAGNGSRNVTNVTINAARVRTSGSHGVRITNADSCVLQCGAITSNTGDGIRIEGDVQNCRIITPISKGNGTFGLREVISGSTPNFNGLIYAIVSGNGNNTITKVGASSYIV